MHGRLPQVLRGDSKAFGDAPQDQGLGILVEGLTGKQNAQAVISQCQRNGHVRHAGGFMDIDDFPGVQSIRNGVAGGMRDKTKGAELAHCNLRLGGVASAALEGESPNGLGIVTWPQQIAVNAGQRDGQVHGAAEAAQNFSPAGLIQQFSAKVAEVEIG
jgi:hypothetical protein